MCPHEAAPSQTPLRKRWVSVTLILLVIALGLASRRYGQHWPYGLNNHPGDALWALMIFYGWSFVCPTVTPRFLALTSLLTCYLVEFSQLIQAPWLNAIRHTVWGRLVLGASFSWSDLAAYTLGIAAGVWLDRWRLAQGVSPGGVGGFVVPWHRVQAAPAVGLPES